MSAQTPAQFAASRQNAQLSTGPRTPEGKARSSRNAVKLGLFAANDFVRPEDRETYDTVLLAFWDELNPIGPLEETHALEIVRASWRLQRCARIESDLADASLESALDPMQDESAIRTQNAVDRARAQANNTLRRATAELRRLQTERQTRAELELENTENLGLADYGHAVKTFAANERCRLLARQNAGLDSFQAMLAKADRDTAERVRSGDLQPVANRTGAVPLAAAA